MIPYGGIVLRTLYLTFECPSKFYGGGRAIIQSLESLSAFSEIDYVGLEFNRAEFNNFNIRNTWFIKKKNHLFACIKNMFSGLPTFYYGSWKRLMKKIDFSEYDYAFIEFSHLDFVVKMCQQNNLKVITRVHNVESDMVKSVAGAKKFNIHKLRAIINGKAILKREKKDLQDSDKIIFLTEEDRTRAQLIYKADYSEKSIVVPICMNLPKCDSNKKVLDFEYILATGSLNYGANYEGISWLLREVWKPLYEEKNSFDIKLVVAGSNPTDSMIELCKRTPNCVLVDTPEDISPYLNSAKFYLAPIFVGAGMKVKVAEALSFGLRIVGTDHAFIGYEKAKEFLFPANNAQEFKSNIKYLLEQNVDIEEHNACKAIFKKEFSMDVSRKRYKDIVYNLLNQKD